MAECNDLTNKCNCNCQAYFPNNRLLTVESLVIDDTTYEFSYLITNPNPSLDSIVFCIQCPIATFQSTSENTQVTAIGYPSGSSILSSVEFDFDEESSCCFYQGIKINVAPPVGTTEIRFVITFTVPSDVELSFQSGVLKITNGDEVDIVNYVCMPGCKPTCDRDENICAMWLHEKEIIVSKKDTFIHYSQNLFPSDFNFDDITLSELDQKVRLLQKAERSIAKLNCDVAKVLESLNNNESNDHCCI